MVAFRNTDTSGRTTGLLLRCVLYSLAGPRRSSSSTSATIISARFAALLSIVAYPVQIAVASPFEGWDWFRESVTTRDALRADKAKLEAELRLAQFRLQRYEALEAESQRLRALRDNTAGVDRPLHHRRRHGCGSGCLSRAGAGGQGRAATASSSDRRCSTPAACSARSRASGN